VSVQDGWDGHTPRGNTDGFSPQEQLEALAGGEESGREGETRGDDPSEAKW